MGGRRLPAEAGRDARKLEPDGRRVGPGIYLGLQQPKSVLRKRIQTGTLLIIEYLFLKHMFAKVSGMINDSPCIKSTIAGVRKICKNML
jgi:hypothetical protein